jgi:hypothetical protein
MRALLLRVLALLVATSSLLCVAAPARAQALPAITLPVNNYVRREQPVRPAGQLPTWINSSDCWYDDQLTFGLGFTGYTGNSLTLQAWVGTANCKDPDSRTGSNPTCWLVLQETPQSGKTAYDVTLDAQRIVGQHIHLNGPPPVPPPGTKADCFSNRNIHQALYIDFMFVDANNTLVGTPAEYQMGYDISPPDPLTDVTASPGDTRIHLSWTVPATAATDILEYRLYCTPLGGAPGSSDAGLLGTASFALAEAGAGAAAGTGGALAAGGAGGALATGGAGGTLATGGAGGAATGGTSTITDAGTAGTAGSTGTDAGGLASESCDPNSVLKPGGLPDEAYNCGSSGRNASDGTAQGLTNGTTYVVAVAAVDTVGNVGRLSANVCEVPVNLTDFYELYRGRGGLGGGGICSVSSVRPGTVSTWLLSLVGIFVGAGAVRRLRRRS